MTELILQPDPRRQWTDAALCSGKTHLFFARAAERPGARRHREALAATYCARCPVRDACRTYAREHRENGFWGGESEEDRAAAGYPPRSITRRSVAEAAEGATGAVAS